jgi:hypothetical protein
MEPFGIGLFPDGRVQLSPGLRSYPVYDAAQRQVATVHGTLVRGWAGDGITVADTEIRTEFPVADLATLEDRVQPGLFGCFVLEACPPLSRRLYVDAGGTLPMLWCEESGRAGSTPAIILDVEEERQRFDHERWQRLVVREGSGWISGTLTAHRKLRRLLPGHWLDRDTLQTGRFWPRPGTLTTPLGLEEGALQFAAVMRGAVEATVRERRSAISLTAGFDSRLLLAASRAVLHDACYYTVPVDAIDTWQATRMARELGFSHRLLPPAPSTPEEAQWWDHAVGYCVREGNRNNFRTLAGLDCDVAINGAFGEPGRSHLYKHDGAGIDQRRIDAASLLARLTIPASPELVEEIERWLEPLGWLRPAQILDLGYIELRGASWAMAQAPAQKAVKWTLAPFAQRAVFDVFLRVPPAAKGTRALFERTGELLWPEAMRFPINRYGDARDLLKYWKQVKKLGRREKLTRFVRSRFGR